MIFSLIHLKKEHLKHNLVQTLNYLPLQKSKKILDVGTGSGCIILSLLKERPKCLGTAIDISKKAINLAISNEKMHHLENKINFKNIDIDKFIDNKYDFIISNPPYINDINFKRLEANVKQFEPRVALKAGVEGLKIIKNTAIEIEPNSFNKKYLETKRDKMGHEILKHKH